MAAKPCSLRLHQIRGPSLDAKKVLYAVLNEWFYKPREFIQSDSFSFLKDEIAEVYIFDLTDKNAGIVDSLWFGSSGKKDTVIVATLFGIVGRVFRRKNLDADEIAGSVEFQVIRGLLNSLQYDSEMVPRQNRISTLTPTQPLFETPPSTSCKETVNLPSFDQPFKNLQELDPSMGPWLYMKYARAITKSCIKSFRGGQVSGLDIGKFFGFGLLYGPDESQKHLVKDVLSTALCAVAKKALNKRSTYHCVIVSICKFAFSSLGLEDKCKYDFIWCLSLI